MQFEDTITPAKAAHVKYLADGKVMKVQKTRQRKILSCIYCHSKKIKCSRVQPVCNNCDKLGIPCQYFANKRVSRGGKKKDEDSNQHSGQNQYQKMQRSSSEAERRQESISSLSEDDDVSSPRSPDFKDSDPLVKDSDDTHFRTSNGDNRRHSQAPSSTTSQSSASERNNGTDSGVPGTGNGHDSNANDSPNHANSVIIGVDGVSVDNTPTINNSGKNNLNNASDINFSYMLDLSMKKQGGQQQQVQQPTINSLLQTPVMNTFSNNITNNFFNTNYSNQSNTNTHATQTPSDNIDPYNFNINSFAFQSNDLTQANINSQQNALMNIPQSVTNFIDQNAHHVANGGYQAQNQQSPENQTSPDAFNFQQSSSVVKAPKPPHQPNNPGLHNSLNAYPSNPETTMNYLYGTNTNYNNEQLLEELLKHLPASRERSNELVDRYVNSVHILLPVMCNKMGDFCAEHEKFWDYYDHVLRKKNTPSPSNSSTSSSGNSPDIDVLQFYTLYFPVLYAATISEFEEYDNLLLNQDINLYLKAFNKICQYHNYPHGLKTIPLLLGNVIIQSTSPNPSTMEMSQIIRYAKFLHMHKDPTLTLRITDWKAVKFRRMLWWCIFGLDALTSHNFCLPPVCKFDDFNVLMPSEDEPIEDGIDGSGSGGHKLNVGVLSLKIKFKYDRILSELVYRLHGLTTDITPEDTELIKNMIVGLFEYIQECMEKIANHYRMNPPSTVQEMNLINFIKNHSWSYVDRALMLLHKKILLGQPSHAKSNRGGHSVYSNGMNGASGRNVGVNNGAEETSNHGSGNSNNGSGNGVKSENADDDDTSGSRPRYNSSASSQGGQISATGPGGLIKSTPMRHGLSLGEYEDTFGFIQEANIVSNFDHSTISQLKFNQYEDFSYENLHNNLIPSILHNLNDFLKYNDFIKFGKYNWYVKRTIPLDSIILMFIIITVKFKYEFMTINELGVYVKLINKALFILNRKWFKNEKYKRMLSLANLTWEFMLKKYNIINIINQHSQQLEAANGGSKGGEVGLSGNGERKATGRIEFFDYQVTGYLNMSELFNVMDVPQPCHLSRKGQRALGNGQNQNQNNRGRENSSSNASGSKTSSTNYPASFFANTIISSQQIHENNQIRESELMQLNEKIYYDLRNNFVDINDYCAFYSSLENILRELMDYINR